MGTRTDVIRAWAAETAERGRRSWWRDLYWGLKETRVAWSAAIHAKS